MKFSGVLFLAIAVAARLPARWPAHLLVRGGADTLDDLEAAASPTLGDLDKSAAAKRSEGFKKAVKMMPQMGGKGEAIDKLEAATANDDATEAELVELYMLARREQAKALVDPSAGDHLAQALRMIALESMEHHDGGRLPDEAHSRVMDLIAEDLSFSSRAEFEADLAAKSDENAEQMLTMLKARATRQIHAGARG